MAVQHDVRLAGVTGTGNASVNQHDAVGVGTNLWYSSALAALILTENDLVYEEEEEHHASASRLTVNSWR